MVIENQEISIFEGNYKQFIFEQTETERSIEEDKKLLLETRITEILSRLSIEPSDELENKFQELIKQKRELDN